MPLESVMFRLVDLLMTLCEKIFGCAFTRNGDILYRPDDRLYPAPDHRDLT
jgi:hypothetical protein